MFHNTSSKQKILTPFTSFTPSPPPKKKNKKKQKTKTKTNKQNNNNNKQKTNSRKSQIFHVNRHPSHKNHCSFHFIGSPMHIHIFYARLCTLQEHLRYLVGSLLSYHYLHFIMALCFILHPCHENNGISISLLGLERLRYQPMPLFRSRALTLTARRAKRTLMRAPCWRGQNKAWKNFVSTTPRLSSCGRQRYSRSRRKRKAVGAPWWRPT